MDDFRLQRSKISDALILHGYDNEWPEEFLKGALDVLFMCQTPMHLDVFVEHFITNLRRLDE